MVRCPSCGNIISSSADKCTRCGTVIKDKSKKETKWIIITQIVIITVILISIFLAINLSNSNSKYMTYKEFSKLKLDDVYENDIYYIKDTISNIWENDTLKATYINFTSMDGNRVRLRDIKYQPDANVDWDLTDNFFQGDRVIVTIRIINVEKYDFHGVTGGGFSQEVVMVEHAL